MSTHAQPSWETLLDAHLAGRLDSAGRRAFDEHLQANPQARAELELQTAIDGALRRRIQAGAPDRLWAKVQAAERAGRVLKLQSRQRWYRRGTLAIAALILLAIGGGVWFRWGRGAGRSGVDNMDYPVQPWRTFEMVYNDEVAAGFKCQWECKSDREFAGTFYKRFGQGLMLADLPAGVHSVGLAYCNTLSRNTVLLLANVQASGVQASNVLVFIDRPGQYDDLQVSPNSGLHLFKRKVGSLILCEITPLDRPYLLNAFYDPQLPSCSYGVTAPAGTVGP